MWICLIEACFPGIVASSIEASWQLSLRSSCYSFGPLSWRLQLVAPFKDLVSICHAELTWHQLATLHDISQCINCIAWHVHLMSSLVRLCSTLHHVGGSGLLPLSPVHCGAIKWAGATYTEMLVVGATLTTVCIPYMSYSTGLAWESRMLTLRKHICTYAATKACPGL